MSYLGRIIDEITRNERSHAEALTSLLLWRGFLVWTDQRYVYLHEGSTERDIDCCARIAAELNMAFSFPTARAGAFVLHEYCKYSVSQIAHVIFTQANCGNGGFAGMALENEVAFFRTAFGAKADTVNLDPGVALLVKTIPRIACRTWMSCDGHHLVQKELAGETSNDGSIRKRFNDHRNDGLGVIWFAYDLDRAWFEYAIEQIVSHLELENYFSRCQPSEYDARSEELAIDAKLFPSESFEESCFLRDIYLHKIARALMEDELVFEIREARPMNILEANDLFQ